ncbi:MAG TPA: endo-1,4-beta-xylanase [Vicinamibacterales bacterium]|nr:endo-1,4-beta-xylanase [Vicinamibacterales bacterium]
MRPVRQSVSSLVSNVAVAVALALLAASSSTASAQVVVSHDWEDGTLEGWFVRGGHSLENSTEAAHGGVSSLKTFGRTQTWNGPGLDLRPVLAPNTTYRITGWVRLVAGEAPTNLQLTVERRPSSAPSSSFEFVASAQATDSTWVQIQGNYTFSSADNAVLQVYLEAPGSATAAYYLDDFTIEQLGGPAPPTCPDPPDQSGFFSDFEDGTLQGWGPRGNAVLENVAEAAHSGARSLKVTNRMAAWQGPTHDALCKMHNGSVYRVSVWVRLPPGTPDTQVRVSIERRLGGVTNFNTVIPNTVVTDDAWTELRTDSFTFAWDVEQLQIYVETNTGNASFYVDDFRLEHIPPKSIQTHLPRLREVLADYFPIGTAIEPFQTGGRHAELLLHHYNYVTAENAMKMGPIHPQEGTYQFGPADMIADFARENGLRMHGHALLWHQQDPDWLFQNLGSNPRETLIERLQAHIATVVQRYDDVVDSWDVVNEVIDPHAPGGLRQTEYLEIIGPDYIEIAFEAAAAAAGPDDRLCINDFNTHEPAKRDALFSLVQQLRAEGVPVNCVGHQMHINYVNPPIDQIRASLELFGSIPGVVNQITEMDVSVYTNSSDTAPPSEETLVLQGYRYRDLFNLYRELSDIIAVVTFWGLGDDTTWLRNFPIARPDAPLPFDRELQAKHAYWGIVDPSELPIIPQELGVRGRTIRIDGRVELQWDLASPVSMGAEGPLAAAFKALWDPSGLNLLVEVMDPTRNTGDRVEVFIGGTKFVFQGVGKQKNGLDAMIVPIQGGYRLEAAMPSNEPLQIGDVIHADIRVTDASDGGRQLSWSDTSHSQDDDTSNFGVLTLVDAMQASTARRGTPVIDGIEENVWKQAPEIATNTFVLGTSGATASVKLLWDAGRLYVFAKVTDPLLSDASANPWEQDSVEIFVDQNNAKTTSYQSDDMQLRVNFENVQSFGGSATAADFTTATRQVDGGYHVEAAVAMDAPLSAGMVIGFDFQVNDDGQVNGIRSSVKTWNDTTGRAFQDPSQFGVLRLVVAGSPN